MESRTNRLHGNKKANIVTFRTPEIYKEAVEQAITLYSAGSNPEEVLAPTWVEAEKALKEAVKQFKAVAGSVDDVLDESVSKEKKRQYAKAFQHLDRAYNDLLVYNEYVEKSDENEHYLKTTFGLTVDWLEHHHGLYVEVIEQLRTKDDDDGDTQLDIEYQLMTRYREEIDYEYILSLMDRHMDDGLTDLQEKEILKYIEELAHTNPKLGELLRKVWFKIKLNKEEVQYDRAIDILNRYQEDFIEGIIKSLATQWNVNYRDMKFFAEHYNPTREEQVGWSNLAERIHGCYDKAHDYQLEKTHNKLTIKRMAQQAIADTLDAEVVPLRLR